NSLTFCRLTDEAFVVGEGHNRRGRARAFGVFDNARLRTVHDCDAGVGRSEVNANYFCHVQIPFRRCEAVRTRCGTRHLWLIVAIKVPFGPCSDRSVYRCAK
ncbi:UNVERIFIED_CONTAM: hypothetical protein GTU68_014632, partial [Idotea baltica]|nr:hypothetical protein [Idotea baltica]